MIKLHVLNPDPQAETRLTPTKNAVSLTVSRPVARWDTMPPEIWSGSVECARYESVADALAAHDCATVEELLALAPGARCLSNENVIIEGAIPPSPGTVKLTSLFARLPNMTRDAFMAHYPNNHAPLVRKTPELPRYVQNYAVDEGVGEPGGTHFDAVAELWWPEREMAIRSWSSHAVQVEQAHDCTLFIGGPSHTLFGTEEYVVGP